MIFFSLMKDIFELAVGRFKLSSLLLKLFQSSKRLIKQFVQSFTFIFTLGSFFFELFQLN
jgi:hypothetical protein